ELFLDAERPEVQQRLGMRIEIEITDLRQQHQVGAEQRAGDGIFRQRGQFVRQQDGNAGGERGQHDDDQRRKNPPDAAGVEFGEAEVSPIEVGNDDLRDQVSGDDEEDVDTDK